MFAEAVRSIMHKESGGERDRASTIKSAEMQASACADGLLIEGVVAFAGGTYTRLLRSIRIFIDESEISRGSWIALFPESNEFKVRDRRVEFQLLLPPALRSAKEVKLALADKEYAIAATRIASSVSERISLPRLNLRLVKGLVTERSDELIFRTIRYLLDIGARKGAYFTFVSIAAPPRLSDPLPYGKAFEIACFCLTQSHEEELFVDEIADLLEEDKKANGLSYWYHHHQGHLANRRDQFSPTSYMHYALAARRLVGKDELFHITNGVDSIYPPSDYDDGAGVPSSIGRPQTAFRENVFEASTGEPKWIHLVCCDGGYMRRFLGNLLWSHRDFSPSSGMVVCHLVNPEEEDLAVARQLASEYPGFVVFDAESTDFPQEMPQISWKAYMTTPRFTRALRVMERYNAPVLASDIDLVVSRSPDRLVEELSDWPVGMSYGGLTLRNYYPWLRAGAQFSYFGNNDVSRRMLRGIRNYIEEHFNWQPGATNWLIDQIALWQALLSSKGERIQKLRRNMLFVPQEK